MDLHDLTARTDPAVSVGIGLVEGDPREGKVLGAATFCSVIIYREARAMLGALDAGEIQAAVRGSLSSSTFLDELRPRRHTAHARRIALLRLPDGRPFLLGPVGIDEGGTLAGMRSLARDCREFCGLLGWEPRVAVLSTGRAEDAGRSAAIARSIERGERLAAEEPSVRHYHILLEEALDWANCVIAPDGVTGNLIYRTLTHLGSGTSLGALYFPLGLRLADTSRAGTAEEYLGAIAIANLSVVSGTLPCFSH